MADNVVANPGAGGATFATDQDTGNSVHHPISKLEWGPYDTFNLVDDVSGKRLPVKISESTTLTVTNAALSVVGGGVEATALRVTLASDSTGLLSVDDNGGSLTVDVGTALPAGTNNIGDVDVISVIPGVGQTNLGKAEDAAHTSGDTGVLSLAVRNDAGAALAGTDLDYIPLTTDSTGALRVTGGGAGVQYTEADTDATITGTAFLWEDTADTLRAVSAAKPLPIGDAGGSLTIDNAALAVVGGGVEAGALRVTIASDSTGLLSVDDNGGSLTIDGTVTANAGTGTFTVGDGGASLTVDNPALSVVGGGVEATALRVTLASDGTGLVSVDDNGGSLTIDGTVAVSSITTSITPGTAAANLGKAEDAVHSSGDTGVMVLGVRNDAGTALAADGDYIPLSIDSAGALRVTGGGGGTQYTEGDTDASVTGTAMLWEDTSDTLRAVSAAKPLPVAQIGAIPAGTNNMGDVDVASIIAATASGSLGSVDTTVEISLGGYGAVALQITGTWVGTITFEMTLDNTNWSSILMLTAIGGGSNSLTTSNGVWFTAAGGALKLRAKMAVYTSGTASVTFGAVPSGARPLVHIANDLNTTVANVLPGSTAADLGKNEDAAHTSGDTGVFSLAVRRDANTTFVGTDGDYAPFQVDATGALKVSTTRATLTAASPTAASVGTSSAQAVASNTNRRGLVLINTSTNTISLGIGAAAVLASGITLLASGGTWVMDEYTFTTGAINAIAGGAASNLAVQELT